MVNGARLRQRTVCVRACGERGSAGGLAGELVGRCRHCCWHCQVVGRLAGWLAGWLGGWLAGRLGGLLAGWAGWCDAALLLLACSECALAGIVLPWP